MSDRILVVDDNHDVANSVVRLLTLLGHEAKAVYDGIAALEAAADFAPAIAFIDIGMPAIDGYEVVKRIRANGNGAAVLVAHTGWSGGADKQRAYDAGFDLHVAKPVSVDTLHQVLALLKPAFGATLSMRIKQLKQKIDAGQ